ILGSLAAFIALLPAQTPGLLRDLGRYSFEVASVKPSKGDRGGSLGTGEAGRFEATGITLQAMILAAYGGTPGSLPKERLTGGPKWIEANSWDVIAKAPDNKGGIESLLKMLQTLLRDRFHLKLHAEAREMPVFALVQAK